MRIRAGIAAILIAFVPHLADASDEERSAAVATALLIGNSGDMSAAERQQLADAALAYWRHFDSRIPRNSSAEEAWLRRELGTMDLARIAYATDSFANALDRLKNTSSNCVKTFDVLVKNIGRDKATELYWWLKVTQCYSNTNTVRYLGIAELSDGTYDGAFKMRTFGLVLSTITGKLANGIIHE